MLRRINQPATEPMEAVLPEYLAMEIMDVKRDSGNSILANVKREKVKYVYNLRSRLTVVWYYQNNQANLYNK